MTELKFTHEDAEYVYYETFYKGKKLRISKEKATGENFFHAEDIANCLGYPSVAAMEDEYNRRVTAAASLTSKIGTA